MTEEPAREGRADRLLAALLALAALLPFARGLLSGHSLFFRDLAGHFFPAHRFVARGLLQGELRYWNPFSHEGAPLSLPALGYPPDLLHALWSSEAAMSALLLLHVPMAALGAFALARRLGLHGPAAFAVGLAYALGGFTLSSLNLYVYAQALAWAPFLVGSLMACATGALRDAVRAALVFALALSTMGAEIVAQAALLGLVLAWPRDRRCAGRLALAISLGVVLCAVVILPAGALLEGSARGRGFETEVVLAHSVHPITLLQTVVAGLYADPARFTETFWGQNFFPRGFPYFLSLYVGALGAGLALRGALQTGRIPRLLLGLGLFGLVVSLGRYAGLTPLVEALPLLRVFRFPSKAFFTFHLCAALLAGFGIEALRHRPEAWRRTGLLLLGIGVAVAMLPWIALQPAGFHRYLIAGFFPPHLDAAARERAALAILHDAWTGGLVAFGAGLLVLATARGFLGAGRATWLVVALLGADLVRAGAGLNPMVSPSFFTPSTEMRQVAQAVQAAGGRLFTFDAGYSPAYYQARAARRDHEVWSFAVLQETLVPSFNLDLEVKTALSLDQTMLVSERQVLPPQHAQPATLATVLGRLREAAVSHVLSVEPLVHPDLEPLATPTPPRIAPLRTHLYRLRGSRHRLEMEPGACSPQVARETPGTLEIESTCEEPATLVIRDSWAKGWRVEVDGAPATLLRHGDHHRAVALGPGSHRVRFAYRAPRLTAGLVASGAAAALVLALLVGRRRGDADDATLRPRSSL